MPSDYLFTFDLKIRRDTWIASEKMLKNVDKFQNIFRDGSYFIDNTVRFKITKGKTVVLEFRPYSFAFFMNGVVDKFEHFISMKGIYAIDDEDCFIIFSEVNKLNLYSVEYLEDVNMTCMSEEDFIDTAIIDIAERDFERTFRIFQRCTLSSYQFIKGILKMGRDYHKMLLAVRDYIDRNPENMRFEPYRESVCHTYAFLDIFQAQEPAMMQWLQSKNPHDTLEED